MASPSDSNVQLPGGQQSGPQVRTLQLTVLDNGSPVTVQMQVVQIADEQGNIIGNAVPAYQAAILAELRAMRRLMQAQLGVFDASVPDDTVQPEIS